MITEVVALEEGPPASGLRTLPGPGRHRHAGPHPVHPGHGFPDVERFQGAHRTGAFNSPVGGQLHPRGAGRPGRAGPGPPTDRGPGAGRVRPDRATGGDPGCTASGAASSIPGHGLDHAETHRAHHGTSGVAAGRGERAWPASPAGATTTAGGCWSSGSWPWSAQRGGPGGRQQLLQQPDRWQPSRSSRSSNQAFPAQTGSPAQVVITTTGPVTDAANQARTARAGRALAPLAHVSAVVSPFVRRRGPPDLRRRPHRLRAGATSTSRPATCPQAAIQTVIDTAQSFDAPGYHVALGRPGHQPGGRGEAGPERGHRHPGRHHHHAAGLRLGGGHGPAHHHRPVRHRHRLRRARPAVPRDHHPDLRPRDDGHDRTRRGHRLRPVHRHPLPAGPGRGPRPRARRRRSRWPPRAGRWCSPAPR